MASALLRQPADPSLYPPGGDAKPVQVVDHGYHAGLILPRRALADVASEAGLDRLVSAVSVFAAFEHVEIGWGEEGFYKNVPAANLGAAPHALKALLLPWNASVLHIVGFDGAARQAFRDSAVIDLAVSPEGLRRIARAIDGQFKASSSGAVEPLGPGLYGPSAFFAAIDRYHLLNTCNHWVGQVLAAAGLPYAPVEATLSAGLAFDLRRRAVPMWPHP